MTFGPRDSSYEEGGPKDDDGGDSSDPGSDDSGSDDDGSGGEGGGESDSSGDEGGDDEGGEQGASDDSEPSDDRARDPGPAGQPGPDGERDCPPYAVVTGAGNSGPPEVALPEPSVDTGEFSGSGDCFDPEGCDAPADASRLDPFDRGPVINPPPE